MRIKFLLGFFACGLCLAQYDPALRLGPFHNLQKAGSIEVLVEFPKNATAKASEFHLFEDGKSTSSGATVTQFRNSNWKVALVLAVDVSLSIKPPVFDEIRKACIEFASQSKDPVGLIAFGDTAVPLAPLDAPREKLVAALSQLKPVGHRTQLYLALDAALSQFDNRTVPERQRIIVISDGGEDSHGGPNSVDDEIGKAAKRRIAIDTIWIPNTMVGARNTLVRMSERTDGYHGDAAQSAEILSSFRQIQRRIDNAFIVSFDRKIDGSILTKEIGIGVDKPGIASASIALQIPATAAKGRSLLEWFQYLMGLIGNFQTLIGLFGGAAALYSVYTGSYVFVEKHYAAYLSLFPFNPFFWRRKPPPPAPQPPPDPIVKPTPVVLKPQQRRTVVEHSQDPVSPPTGLVLSAIKGPVQGRQIAIANKYFSIGADPDSDLPLPSDEYVSGHHAIIQASGNGWVLIDPGSRNGTYVDGRKLERGPGQVLRPGQSIQIGTSEFRVILSNDANPARVSADTGPVR